MLMNRREILNRVFPRLRLDEREAVDELLRLGVRPVGRGKLPSGELDLRPLGRPLQPAGHEQHARRSHFLAELAIAAMCSGVGGVFFVWA